MKLYGIFLIKGACRIYIINRIIQRASRLLSHIGNPKKSSGLVLEAVMVICFLSLVVA